jgi:hypothetical protein
MGVQNKMSLVFDIKKKMLKILLDSLINLAYLCDLITFSNFLFSSHSSCKIVDSIHDEAAITCK